jgi:hypothetical protein
VIEKREEVDWKRHGVFISFGLFYLVSKQQPSLFYHMSGQAAASIAVQLSSATCSAFMHLAESST